MTLPVIHALASLEGERKESLLTLLVADTVSVESVIGILNECDSIEYSRGVAKSIAERAVGFAADLPDSDAAKSLAAIGAMMLQRTY